MPLLKPIHQPRFTPEQLEQARQVAVRHSAPHREVLRARLTLLLAEKPEISHQEAARRSGLSAKAVEKWRRRWDEEGWSLTDAPRSGRPAAFPPGGPDRRQGSGL